MKTRKAKINFVLELNSVEVPLPTQEAAEVLMKKLNKLFIGLQRKALNLPKDAVFLNDKQSSPETPATFSGALIGKTGDDNEGWLLKEFGEVPAEESEDSDDEESDEEDDSEEDDADVPATTPTENDDDESDDETSDGNPQESASETPAEVTSTSKPASKPFPGRRGKK